MDVRTIIDKTASTIVAAISGYVAIEEGATIPGLLGALGTMCIAMSIAYYIYKDSNANSRLKNAQAHQVEITNDEAKLKIIILQKKSQSDTNNTNDPTC